MNEVTMKISKSGLKRFWALFLSLCLCLTTIQMNVWAGEDAVTVKEITLSENSLSLKVGDKTNLTATVTLGTDDEGKQTDDEGNQPPKQTDDEGNQPPKQTDDEGNQPPKQTDDEGNQPPKQTDDEGNQPPKQTDDEGNQPPKQTDDEGNQPPKQTDDEGNQPQPPKQTNDEAATGAAADDVQVSWTSSDEKVVTVTKQGKTVRVNAVGAGTATITATAGGKSAECKVTVTKADDDNKDKVESVSLSQKTLSIEAGKTATLTATVKPAGTAVTWTTSNASVATVVNGVVTAKAAGTAVITATAGDKSDSCTVTVTAPAINTEKPAPTGVTLDKTAATVAKGKTLKLTATVAPANANNTSVTWTTSDSKIATVSNGTVTGKKAGEATITATTVNGKTATCKITVAEVTLNAKETVIQVGKSSAAVKVATKYPAKDSVKSYESANKKIATVDKKGKVTGKKVGKTTITVTMKSGATATFKVTVQKGEVVTKSLKFAAKSLNVAKGKKATLSVTRNPISATEKLTYTSSNKKVATVDKNGKVTGKAYGTAKITVKSANGKKATCTVKVVPNVTLKKTKASIKVNGTTTIAVKSLIKGDKVKSYKSADTKIATVNSKGKVTGKKAGTTTITVTTKKGGTAIFTVTVK